MRFFYDLFWYITDFSVIVIFTLIAMFAVKRKFAWLFYTIGAIWQLAQISTDQLIDNTISINTSGGIDITLYWIGYPIFLIISALLIAKWHNHKDKRTAELLQKEKSEEIKKDSEYKEMLENIVFCKNCGADTSNDNGKCHVCGMHLENTNMTHIN